MRDPILHIDLWAAARIAQPTSTADILRSFDELRRVLAQASHGHDGAFAGFDALQVSEPSEQERLVVTCAYVDQGFTRSQVVRYYALDLDIPFGRSRLLASGVGRTIALPPALLCPSPTDEGSRSIPTRTRHSSSRGLALGPTHLISARRPEGSRSGASEPLSASLTHKEELTSWNW